MISLTRPFLLDYRLIRQLHYRDGATAEIKVIQARQPYPQLPQSKTTRVDFVKYRDMIEVY